MKQHSKSCILEQKQIVENYFHILGLSIQTTCVLSSPPASPQQKLLKFRSNALVNSLMSPVTRTKDTFALCSSTLPSRYSQIGTEGGGGESRQSRPNSRPTPETMFKVLNSFHVFLLFSWLCRRRTFFLGAVGPRRYLAYFCL